MYVILVEPLETSPKVVVVLTSFPKNNDIILDLDDTLQSTQDFGHGGIPPKQGSSHD